MTCLMSCSTIIGIINFNNTTSIYTRSSKKCFLYRNHLKESVKSRFFYAN